MGLRRSSFALSLASWASALLCAVYILGKDLFYLLVLVYSTCSKATGGEAPLRRGCFFTDPMDYLHIYPRALQGVCASTRNTPR